LDYRKYGVDPAPALQQTQIAPSLLRRAQGRVDARQFEALCSAAMQQLDDEALGWFSRRLPRGSYGLLCRAPLGAPTLGLALKRWAFAAKRASRTPSGIGAACRPGHGGAMQTPPYSRLLRAEYNQGAQ
jgi:hypothetical protein